MAEQVISSMKNELDKMSVESVKWFCIKSNNTKCTRRGHPDCCSKDHDIILKVKRIIKNMYMPDVFQTFRNHCIDAKIRTVGLPVLSQHFMDWLTLTSQRCSISEPGAYGEFDLSYEDVGRFDTRFCANEITRFLLQDYLTFFEIEHGESTNRFVYLFAHL